MTWNLNNVLAEIFYCLIGIVFILVGVKALRDKQGKRRITTVLFWFILAFTFIAGPYLPKWITGLCVVIIAGLTACKGVKESASDTLSPDSTRKQAEKIGYKIFIAPLCLALVAVLVASFLSSAISANNAIGIAAAAALLVVFVITRTPPKNTVIDGTRLMDNVGPVGILPQLLAALGALFTAAGVGDVIAKGVSTIIPEGNRLIATAVYCIGMALFTIIMGNGFAAFSVITVGIGLPFLILHGANPVVVGALGLTAGYCGTLCTPMAANFNIMPAALLQTKDKYVIIKSQLPAAGVLLLIHIILMYILAF
ncbi:MAG: DUF979 domain-containing protein [Treponema sp.]|jgi:uncharacterized membrane protein|nr:DUF979 domain-containing protein [Treponema sp.]